MDDMEKNDRMIGDVYDQGDDFLKTVTGQMKVGLFSLFVCLYLFFIHF